MLLGADGGTNGLCKSLVNSDGENISGTENCRLPISGTPVFSEPSELLSEAPIRVANRYSFPDPKCLTASSSSKDPGKAAPHTNFTLVYLKHKFN